MLTVSPLDRIDGVAHGFFGRDGGVSTGIYASLNCGLGSRDERASVTANRALAMTALGAAPDRLITCYQIHSAKALIVRDGWQPEDMPQADAMATDQPGLCLGIVTADCVPVLLADPEAGVIGTAHAGWKGAVAGVLQSVVEAMTSLGASPPRIVAAIGPAIQQPSYEVGPEFPKRFEGSAQFFIPSSRAGHFMFDLPGYVASRLTQLGLSTIGNVGLDTASLPEQFFSYRRSVLAGEPDYGRFLSAIVLR